MISTEPTIQPIEDLRSQRPHLTDEQKRQVFWAAAEYVTRGKPSILGFCTGAVAGLVPYRAAPVAEELQQR